MNFIDKLLLCRQRLEGKSGAGAGEGSLKWWEGSLKYVERYLKGGEGSLKCVTNHKKLHLCESSE